MTDILDASGSQVRATDDALLGPLLTYLLTAREVAGGDLDLNIILLVIAMRTIDHPEMSNLSDQQRIDRFSVFPTLGVNITSIAESSGIPRETVRRKTAELVRKGWIVRQGANLHFTAKAFVELTAIREARRRLANRFYEIVRSEAVERAAGRS